MPTERAGAAEHAWNLTPAEARTVQERLARRVELRDRLGPVRTIAETLAEHNANVRRWRQIEAGLNPDRETHVDATLSKFVSSLTYMLLMTFVILAAIDKLGADFRGITRDAQQPQELHDTRRGRRGIDA